MRGNLIRESAVAPRLTEQSTTETPASGFAVMSVSLLSVCGGVIVARQQIKGRGGETNAHLFCVDDASDVFPEDWIHAEDAEQHGQAQESLPDPHLHLSLSSAAARLLSELPEARLRARARVDGERGIRRARAGCLNACAPPPSGRWSWMADDGMVVV